MYCAPNQGRRLAQDSPVSSEVWFAYGEDASRRIDLLLTPNINVSNTSQLCAALRARLKAERLEGTVASDVWKRLHESVSGSPQVLFNDAVVLAHFSFYELLRIALPLSEWWYRTILPVLASRAPEELEALGFDHWERELAAYRKHPGGD